MYTLTNIFLVAIVTTITIGQKIDESCVLISNNITGTCKFSKDCPEVDKLTSEGKDVQLCGFFLSVRPIFCCPNAPSSPPSSLPPVIPSMVESTAPGVDEAFAINYAKQMCAEYSKNYTKIVYTSHLAVNSEPTQSIESQCDKNGINLISSGNATALKEFPFAAALGVRKDDNSIQWLCGGSLISERFVLTAAHCLTSLKKSSTLVVRLGDYNLTNDNDGAIHKDFSIETVSIHQNYAPPATYNDIALIKLNEIVIFTDFIKPACLWTEPNEIIKNLTIAIGWGDTDFAAIKGSDVLLKVGLLVYDNSVCQTYYSASSEKEFFPRGVQSSMLCAGDIESEKDTCQGDSGGPLLKVNEENSCIQYIVGITSHGKACALKKSAAVYTRVSSYLGWIVNTIMHN